MRRCPQFPQGAAAVNLLDRLKRFLAQSLPTGNREDAINRSELEAEAKGPKGVERRQLDRRGARDGTRALIIDDSATVTAALARMLLHSDSYRMLTQQAMAMADRHCEGKLVVVHEGGYAEAAVPFCGHAVVETLAAESLGVEDPFLELFQAWQPNPRFAAFQRGLIDEMVSLHGL